MQDIEPRELDPRLKDKFRLKGILPGKIFFKKKDWDFRNMDEKSAEKLIELGCVFIEKIDAQPETAAASAKAGTSNERIPSEKKNRR